ncbi:MAG: hypothetical protein E7254_10470 [Lachnospiraceae bacterium]|nr:hypothetical protein [Lachnospiraceae bacterium]
MTINRFVCLWSLILCMVCVFVSTTGCDKDTDSYKKNATYIYYVDKTETKLVPREYKVKAKNSKKQVEEVIGKLQLNTDNVDIVKAIPSEVTLKDYTLEDGVLSMAFSTDYLSMNRAREVLTRAAIVLTLTQLENVSYVSISVDGQPLTKSTGEVYGNMSAVDFADNLDNNQNGNHKDDFTIYFANSQGTKLVPFKFNADYGLNMSKEQFIINKLIEGPGEKQGYIRTLSENVNVVSVKTMDNICYVTFAENFLTEQVTVPDELVIYSIVNSLSELSYIHKVQVIVIGEVGATYHGTISLADAFTRNLDYVEKNDDTE